MNRGFNSLRRFDEVFVPQATQVVQAQAMAESVSEFARTGQPMRERMEAIEKAEERREAARRAALAATRYTLSPTPGGDLTLTHARRHAPNSPFLLYARHPLSVFVREALLAA